MRIGGLLRWAEKQKHSDKLTKQEEQIILLKPMLK